MLANSHLVALTASGRPHLDHRYSLPINTQLDRGRYTISQLIYIGESGYVYAGKQNTTQKNVIIKELFPQVPLLIEGYTFYVTRENRAKNIAIKSQHPQLGSVK